MMTRIFVVIFAIMTGAAAYATYYGIGAESFDVQKSVRAGSAGNVRAYGIK